LVSNDPRYVAELLYRLQNGSFYLRLNLFQSLWYFIAARHKSRLHKLMMMIVVKMMMMMMTTTTTMIMMMIMMTKLQI